MDSLEKRLEQQLIGQVTSVEREKKKSGDVNVHSGI